MKNYHDTDELEELRKHFNGLEIEERIKFIDTLSPEAYRYLKYSTDVFYWDKQIIPDDDYHYYFLLGGRGSSKTYTLCHEIKRRLMRGDPGLMLVAASYDDLNDVLVPTILDQFPSDAPAIHNSQKKVITAPNGNSISLKSAEKGIIKGRNTTTCFIDELSECWNTSDLEKQLNYWRILDGNIRKGNAQMIMTSNPETSPLFRHIYDMHLQDHDNVRIISSSIYDNPYLSPEKRDLYVKQWKGTRYEKMQLLGQLDWTQDGALWNMELINETRIFNSNCNSVKDYINYIANPNPARKQYFNPYDFFWAFIICVDPAMSVSETSDETGIVIAGIGQNNHIYILEDLSGKWLPDDMAEIVQQARQRYPRLRIGIETNQGGMYVLNALKIKDPYVENVIEEVWTTERKMTRAQHIVIQWDQKSSHIVGKMDQLEKQMIYYTGKPGQKSPDRFDAMVMCCQKLGIDGFDSSGIDINSLPKR